MPVRLVGTHGVMALGRAASRALRWKLVPASALMILLGYPGEIAASTGARAVWGGLSTIPFLYLLYVLFIELSRSLGRQPEEVRTSIKRLRISLLASCGVYPIVFFFPHHCRRLLRLAQRLRAWPCRLAPR